MSLDPHLEILNPGTLATLAGLPDCTTAYRLSQGQKLGWGFPGGSAVKNLPAMQETQERCLRLEDPPKEGMTTLEEGMILQCSCLENPVDTGAWRATVHRVAESDTTEQLGTHAHSLLDSE